ncbi:MAG: NUDIX hydrolase [Acidobacteriales bacterium]|nr:NUDIX hydrolase [Terriglobales bacterium]
MERQHPERPIVGVGALIVQEGRIVLVRRGQKPGKGEWSLPGGVVETGETLESAVRREVREETGLNVEVRELAGVFDRILPDAAGRTEYHYVLIDYLCRVVGGALRAGSDVEAVRWAGHNELDGLQLTEATREVIKKYLP